MDSDPPLCVPFKVLSVPSQPVGSYSESFIAQKLSCSTCCLWISSPSSILLLSCGVQSCAHYQICSLGAAQHKARPAEAFLRAEIHSCSALTSCCSCPRCSSVGSAGRMSRRMSRPPRGGWVCGRLAATTPWAKSLPPVRHRGRRQLLSIDPRPPLGSLRYWTAKTRFGSSFTRILWRIPVEMFTLQFQDSFPFIFTYCWVCI